MWSNSTLSQETYSNNTSLYQEGWREFFVRKKHIINVISKELEKEDKAGYIIYPPLELVFNAFWWCPSPKDIKVVLLGMDPYPHNPREAMGLSFSVPDGVNIPSSLRNIYKELKDDGFEPNYDSGNLLAWAVQGVFLANMAFTVRSSTPGSHSKIWHPLSTQLVLELAKQPYLVWILWGNNAKSIESYIPRSHGKVKSVHPSGHSAAKGFFGSKPFSKVNALLESKGIEPIDWNLQ